MDVMVARAVMVLRNDGVVAYPTDTVYGLAVDPRSVPAVEKLFRVKERNPGHPVPLIATDRLQIEAVAVLTPLGRRLADAFWPGPLSLVLSARPGVVPQVQAADGSIAVRIPASETACALARAFGFCITSTSANLSGEPPISDPVDIQVLLDHRIDFLLDGGVAPGGAPSTIVDVRGPAVRLVRAGAVPWERVLESLQ